jgi:vacuolar-type H+-ATPase subunit I/STV1
MLDKIKKASLIFFLVGIGIFICGFMYFAMLLIFSENVTHKIRIKYLESILK